MNAWRLLLTRPAEDCAVTAQALAEQGIYSSSLPLLAIEPFAETPEQRTLILDLDRYHAVIVVSKPAARLGLDLVDRYWPQPPLGPQWFSLGEATGHILSDYGLDVSWSEQGVDSEALLAHPQLIKALAQPEPRVLFIKGEGGRSLLGDNLNAQGVQTDNLTLYRRKQPQYAPNTLLQRLTDEALNGLVVTSGQGLLSLRALAADAWPIPVTLFVPSSRVAEMARQMGMGNIVDCCGAGTPALLNALRNTPVPTAA